MKRQLLAFAVAVWAMGPVVQAGPVPNAPGPNDDGSAASAQLSPAQRRAIVDRIVRTWGPFAQTVYTTSPAAWAKRMASTFAAATDTNLLRAAEMKTFQGMVSTLVGAHLSDDQVIDRLAIQAEVLKSGPIPMLLGDVTDDLVYTPISPCRIVDTRNAGGPIAGGSERDFMGYTATDFSSQGGISGSTCGIPANPSALMLNVTVVAPANAGYLTVWPFGTTRPLASSLNYAAGAIVGNEIVAGMTLGSASDQFSVFSPATGNVVVDAVGYFMAPHQTALDCNRTHSQFTVAAGAQWGGGAVCPTTAGPLTLTGGGCGNATPNTNLKITSNQSYGTNGTSTGWSCEATNTGPNTETLQFDVICCAVPGR
jgi:hypothetical protein